MSDNPSPPARITPAGWIAGIALVLFAILIPWIAFAVVLGYVNVLGATVLEESEWQTVITWSIVGLASGGVAILGAIVVWIISRRSAPKAIAAGAFVFGLLAVFVWGYATSWATSTAWLAYPPEPTRPECGGMSQPTVLGGTDRFTPCPDDVATAERFVAEILPELPTSNVTTDAVDRFAGQVAEDAADAADPVLNSVVYEYSEQTAEGDIRAVWIPAEVTCAILTWDGEAWRSEVTGLLVDGGCVVYGS